MRASSDMFVSQEGVDDRNERKRREGGAEAARAAAPVATTPKRKPRDGGARSPSVSTPRRSVSAYLLCEHAFTFMSCSSATRPCRSKGWLAASTGVCHCRSFLAEHRGRQHVRQAHGQDNEQQLKREAKPKKSKVRRRGFAGVCTCMYACVFV